MNIAQPRITVTRGSLGWNGEKYSAGSGYYPGYYYSSEPCNVVAPLIEISRPALWFWDDG